MSGVHIPPVLLLIGSSDFFLSPDLWWSTGVLFAVLIIAAATLSFVARWRDRSMRNSQDETTSIVSFKTMYENGELSEEEYKAIRDRIAKKKEAAQVRIDPETGMQTINAPPLSGYGAPQGASDGGMNVVFSPGDRVRIKEGVFAGMEVEIKGLVESTEGGASKIQAVVPVYGRPVDVELETGQVDKIA